MIILGIETSTSMGSVALYDTKSERIMVQISISLHAAHSEKLVPYIDFLCHEVSIPQIDIGLIAVSIGPGTFTGLRVGLSTAKGLCLALGVPIVGVDSLMAAAYPYIHISENVASLFDAKRGEVFAAVYNDEPSNLPAVIIEPAIYKLADFMSLCNSVGVSLYVGGNYNNLSSKDTISTQTRFEFPNAASVACLGQILYEKYGESDLSDISPVYLRDFLPGEPRC